jgi:membrane-associated phospholipid phosphatase
MPLPPSSTTTALPVQAAAADQAAPSNAPEVAPDHLTQATPTSQPRGAFDAGSVDWRPEFRRVGWPEYVAIPVLATGILLELLVEPETDADWTGPILLDRPMQDLLRIESASGRSRADTLSDVLVGISALQVLLVDPWLVAGLVHRRTDVAWQMTVIDAQVYGLTLFANRLTKRVVARERPSAEGCSEASSDAECTNEDRYESFFSGHTTSTSTFAGLTCAHHQKQALYGSFAADLGACLGSAGLSLGTGLLRMASDNHWWSDVVVGQLVGFSTSYLLTWARYYVAGKPPASSAQLPVVVPIVGSGVVGLAVGGSL